jgi:hypothetical protein
MISLPCSQSLHAVEIFAGGGGVVDETADDFLVLCGLASSWAFFLMCCFCRVSEKKMRRTTTALLDLVLD